VTIRVRTCVCVCVWCVPDGARVRDHACVYVFDGVCLSVCLPTDVRLCADGTVASQWRAHMRAGVG
jgi:hypothetical protein